MTEKLNKGTPFRKFRLRKSRRCTGCRTTVTASAAWKPALNVGSWKPDAVLCDECVEPKNYDLLPRSSSSDRTFMARRWTRR